MSDFISGCIAGALVASVVVIIVMCLLFASKEAGAPQSQSQQNDIEKNKRIESIYIEFGENYPEDIYDRVHRWKGICDGKYYEGYISAPTSFDNVEVTGAINILAQYALATLKEKV